MQTLDSHVHSALLSSKDILGRYLEGDLMPAKNVQSMVFITLRRRTEYLPDYVYKNTQALAYADSKSLGNILHTALISLADMYLFFDGSLATVKSDLFEDWQNTITRVPPLPLLAAARCSYMSRSHLSDAERLARDNLFASTLPPMAYPVLEDTLAKRGLCELHMHLNGTTESDSVWLDALTQPHVAARALKAAFKGIIDEQLRQTAHFLSPSKLYRMLNLAAQLRQIMVARLFTDKEEQHSQHELRRLFSITLPPTQLSRTIPWKVHPCERHKPELAGNPHLAQEIFFLCAAIEQLPYLETSFAYCLHGYLLIHSCFNALLVQQHSQNGFDQFQRIAENKLRDPCEATYALRFKQLLSTMPGGKCHIEGRFSPKDSPSKNGFLLQAIYKGWDEATQAPSPMANRTDDRRSATEPSQQHQELSLTAHFIKGKEKLPSSACRHRDLRLGLKRKAMQLEHVLRCSKKFRSRLNGIDAAANEMHTPPEVFAPTYRYLRARGWKNFTYHVGEDFVHLLSGIRAIHEAIHFLGLENGDRIGHGTALGISPTLWLKRIGTSVVMSKQEWLDDLIFAHAFLQDIPDEAHHTPRIGQMALELAEEIYPQPLPTLSQLTRAWQCRHMDPLLALSPGFASTAVYTPAARSEVEEVRSFKERYEKAHECYRLYHCDPDVRKNGNELIKVDTGKFPASFYSSLQEALIRVLKSRNVALEVMPTSNVRISWYKSYAEHHLFRLLGMGADPLSTHPSLCIASDDPGIFATSLKNEYAHVFNALREHGKSESEALSLIGCMVDTSWAYRFK